MEMEIEHGLFKHCILVLLFADLSDRLFCHTQEAEKQCAVPVRSDFLCLGRTDQCDLYAAVHSHQLRCRPADGTGGQKRKTPEADYDPGCGIQSGIAGCVQIQRLFRRHLRA